MNKPRAVLFVCSNDTHVRTFSPVVELLRARGSRISIVSLDNYYSQGATAQARGCGLVADHVGRGVAIARTSSFYRRSPMRIVSDVIRLRPVIRAFLRAHPIDVVVVGNDRGIIERAWLTEAHNGGCKTVLIQDGLLSRRSSRAGMRGVFTYRLKRAIGMLMALVGASAYGPALYGASGATYICASGPESAELLLERATSRSRVVVTGQPRYDGLIPGDFRTTPLFKRLVVFTTPFAHAGLGEEAQRLQLEMVEGLCRRAVESGWSVLVKPHPRENADCYRALLGPECVTADSPSLLLRAAMAAVVGISTVVEEAAILGCPVIVPGSPRNPAIESLLPEASVYPRFANVDDVQTYLSLLADDRDWRSELVARQRAWMQARLTFGQGSAASRIANLILAA